MHGITPEEILEFSSGFMRKFNFFLLILSYLETFFGPLALGPLLSPAFAINKSVLESLELESILALTIKLERNISLKLKFW